MEHSPSDRPTDRPPLAAVVVTDAVGRVLLLRRADGRWELPSARVRPAEEPVAAAVRALAEVCGASAEAVRPLGGFGDGPDGAARRQYVFALSAYAPGALGRLVLRRHTTHAWFFTDNLPGLSPAAVRFLRAHAPARPHLSRPQWLATTPRAWLCTAAVLTAPDGRLLMVKSRVREPDRRPDAGRWNFPGGVLDTHEDSPTGAARELREETGLDRPAGPLLAVLWQHPAPGADHPIVQFFHDFGTADPSSVRLACPDGEITDWEWFRPGEELDAAAGPDRGYAARQALAARASGRTVTATYPPRPFEASD
ncbi:hypothetical protein GCM10009639_49800 [Kitasatospora putterlickiae]|uniref:Nudix hydrolase domain-containing protein n=1 Tax=Kitasatospora putterlickiae TaxID=221725 RepID=A0ABP4J124_9ACTN